MKNDKRWRKTEVYVFYIDTAGEYYKAAISAESKEEAQTYLESISREVRYKGIETVKRFVNKKIPCGVLRQYNYYGSKLPRGLEVDRRHHLA